MTRAQTSSRQLPDVYGIAQISGGKRWLAYGDAMRVLGVAAVLVVHVCDMFLFSNRVGQAHWWFANFLDAAGRWAVPVFIMLSGALLLDSSRQEPPWQFYRRRVARLGVAVMFWSAFFMLFAVYWTGWARPDAVWRDLLLGRPYVHLHFVFRLAGLYLITPMLRVYVRNAPWRLRAGMAAVIILLAAANSLVCGLLELQTSGFAIFWSFLGFYLAGNVLREVEVSRRLAAWSWVGFLTSAAAIAGGTGWLVSPSQNGPAPFPSADMLLYDFLSPPRILMSFCAWFMLASVFGRVSEQSLIQRLFKKLAPLTLGVYLVHPLFRELLWVKGYLFNWPNVWVGIPLTALVIGLASLATTYVLSRIPLLRRTVG